MEGRTHREHTTAHPIAGLKHSDVNPSLGEPVRSGEASDAAAYDADT